MVVFLFGGIIAFSLMCACPIDKGECDKGRKPVPFPHEMHMESFDCEECHHIYDEDKNNVLDIDELYSDNPDILCSSCHNSEHKINTQEAFHRQCIGCHNEEATLGQAFVPTACNECHRSVPVDSTEYDVIIRGKR